MLEHRGQEQAFDTVGKMIAGKRQMLSDAIRGSARRPYSFDEDRQELSDSEFMVQLRLELQLAANLSDEQIAAYTEDEQAWLAYKADGYSPLEAVEADMEHWD